MRKKTAHIARFGSVVLPNRAELTELDDVFAQNMLNKAQRSSVRDPDNDNQTNGR